MRAGRIRASLDATTVLHHRLVATVADVRCLIQLFDTIGLQFVECAVDILHLEAEVGEVGSDPSPRVSRGYMR